MPNHAKTFIAVDFDGTIVDHCYPDIGNEVPGAFAWLREFQAHGALLILWTMRGGITLKQAVEFCRKNGVVFFGVNENSLQKSWTDSPKCYAHVYVDDAAFGCPLKDNPRAGGRRYVDWSVVGPAVKADMLLAEKYRRAACPHRRWNKEEVIERQN